MSEWVYRVMNREDWETTLSTGLVPRCGSDERDGYVHLSTAATVIETANLYFESAEEPVVAEISSAGLGTALRWEPVASRDGEAFPHLYAPGIPLTSIRAVVSLNTGPEGFSLGPRTEL